MYKYVTKYFLILVVLLSSYSYASDPENWKQQLENIYSDVVGSYQQLRQEYPDVRLPNDLKIWLDQFSKDPFGDANIGATLNNLSEKLNSSIDSSKLNPEVERSINEFTKVIMNSSNGIIDALAGRETTSQPLNQLKDLTRLHNSDQSRINHHGMELSDKLKKGDLSGAYRQLEGLVKEYKAKNY